MNNDDRDNIIELTEKTKKYAIGIGASLIIFAVLALVVNNLKTEPEKIDVTTTTQVADVEAEVNDEPDTRKTETIIVPATEITTVQVYEPVSETVTSRPAPVSYSLPLGTDIGSDYSMGVPVYNAVMGDWRTHNGVDFNGEYGDGVKAIAGGIVREVSDDPIMGGTVVIDHGGGIVATYNGVVADENIRKGIIVSESDKIGEIDFIPGESDSQFPHIHLEIRADGELCDPLEVMGYYE